MISNLKTGLKILRYGHGLKGAIIGTVLIVILGIMMAIIHITLGEKTGGVLPVGYFWMLAAMIIIQLFYSVNAATIVQASPLKKKLQTSVPTVLCVVGVLCAYLLTVLVEGIAFAITPAAEGYICRQLIYSTLLLATIMLYSAACYKLFFLTTIMFFVVFFSCYQSMVGSGLQLNLDGSGKTFWLLAAAGLGILLICGVLHYLITLAIYKIPLSKRAQAGALRKEM